ncbi:CLUMA_CG019449, isoform A [Clunio marinus]|uniref:CLUMA_CG019449, isoform A n=1 Tax=Clunio marinus TaxID=568069 RepID=A0A1J1J246_9DIPT|nr:CLUMA_CG019449, isoform A [Clunio marinus]
MTKKVLIMIAEKSETVEIVAPVDTLRRIEGIEVTIASVHGREPVKTTADIIITPDVALSEVDKDAYDAIIMPGGEGYVNLAQSKLVGEILKNQYEKGKLVAGICMSPNVFLANGIGLGNKLTSYPYKTEALKEKYQYVEDNVVQDKNMITSRGPGTVYAYAFKIAENLVSIDKVKASAQLNLFPNLY